MMTRTEIEGTLEVDHDGDDEPTFSSTEILQSPVILQRRPSLSSSVPAAAAFPPVPIGGKAKDWPGRLTRKKTEKELLSKAEEWRCEQEKLKKQRHHQQQDLNQKPGLSRQDSNNSMTSCLDTLRCICCSLELVDSPETDDDEEYYNVSLRFLSASTSTRDVVIHKPLLLTYVLLLAETMMDAITSAIGYAAFVQKDDCCGEPLQMGLIPALITFMFFFILIPIETILWLKGVASIFSPPSQEHHSRCCCRWTAWAFARIINCLAFFNPFFAAGITWMLLYQSTKIGCYIVLGLETTCLCLHFICVYILDRDKLTRCTTIVHAIPILPLLFVVSIIFIYVRQGGICILVEDGTFYYSGCIVCDDGEPPIDNQCCINRTVWNNYTDDLSGELVTIANFNVSCYEVEQSTLRLVQDTYCANGEDPTKFCFFTF